MAPIRTVSILTLQKNIAVPDAHTGKLTDAAFEHACMETAHEKTTPKWITAFLEDPGQKEELETLFTAIKDQSLHLNPRPYTRHLPALDEAYDLYQHYLKTTDYPYPESFTRSPLLIHFCRTLIPVIPNPLIIYETQHDTKKEKEIQDTREALYDALVILVMMNTTIDDSADCLQNLFLVEIMGDIHKTIDQEELLDKIESIKNNQQKAAYRGFLQIAITLWQQATTILKEECGVQDMETNKTFLEGLNSVIDCMKYSMATYHEELDTFENAVNNSSPGMMTHIFFEVEKSVFKSLGLITDPLIDPDIQANHKIKALLQRTNNATLIMARLANDISSLIRELYAGVCTNTLLNLCQEEIAKATTPPKHDLNTLLNQLCKSKQTSDNTQIIADIRELIETFKIIEKAFGFWEAQLKIIQDCEEECKTLLPSPQNMKLAAAIHTLYEGNKKLLLMYIIMNKFKGVT